MHYIQRAIRTPLEFIQGDWGNGEERRNRIEQAGNDFDAVQQRVNEICE
jgi:muramidase (flagellum-specific)